MIVQVHFESPFIDIGIPEDYYKAHDIIKVQDDSNTLRNNLEKSILVKEKVLKDQTF